MGADVNERDERPYDQRLAASVDRNAPAPEQHQRSQEKRTADPAQRHEWLREAAGLPTVPEQPDVKKNEDEPRCTEERGHAAGGDARHPQQITPELVMSQVPVGEHLRAPKT